MKRLIRVLVITGLATLIPAATFGASVFIEGIQGRLVDGTGKDVVDTPGVFSGRAPSTSGTHEGNDNKATGSLEANPT